MSGSRINALFRTAAMWLLFTLFLLIGLASMFSSLLLGPFMLVAALVFAPPINRLIEKRTHITIKARHRVAVAFVCTGLFFTPSAKYKTPTRKNGPLSEPWLSGSRWSKPRKLRLKSCSANKRPAPFESSRLRALPCTSL